MIRRRKSLRKARHLIFREVVGDISGGALVAAYTHGPGIDDPLMMRYNNANYIFHKNHQGSVTEITAANQTTVKTYKYDAFGNILQETGPTVPGGITYTGRQYHSRSGLYYYRARWYSPQLGRFLTQDPIGHLGGVNLYAYVGNSPVDWIDPMGLWTYPTVGPIRGCDPQGCGGYGESRDGGSRTHAGVDYSGPAASEVVAPMGGTLEIINDGVRITGKVEGDIYCTRVLHIEVTADAGSISEGEAIGTINELSLKYPGIINHAHVELYGIDEGKTLRLNPADYIPEYKPRKECP